MTAFMYTLVQTKIYSRFNLFHPRLQFTVDEKENRTIDSLNITLKHMGEGIRETVRKKLFDQENM